MSAISRGTLPWRRSMTLIRSGGSAGSASAERFPVIGGYRVEAAMGSGPLGRVYRAVHTETGRVVLFRGFARPDGDDSESATQTRELLRRRLEAQQRVGHHPGIQGSVEWGEEDGLFWVASEYCEGRTLRQILASDGPRPLAWALRVLRQIAAALEYAADRGLYHTGLSPQNILLVNRDEKGALLEPDAPDVRILDFGLTHTHLQHDLPYAAPEQIAGEPGDKAADIHAVGVLLYDMLAGAPPLPGAKPQALAAQPGFVHDVLALLLAKKPERRYASLHDAIADLEARRSPTAATRRYTLRPAPAPVRGWYSKLDMPGSANIPSDLAEYPLAAVSPPTPVVQEQDLMGGGQEQEARRRSRNFAIRAAALAVVAGALLLPAVATLPGRRATAVVERRIAAASGKRSTPIRKERAERPSSVATVEERQIEASGKHSSREAAPLSQALRPVAHWGEEVLSYPRRLDDQRRVTQALGTMQALCTLVQAVSQEGEAPPRVNPATLEEWGLAPKDRKRILEQFAGQRIVSYRPLRNGGYEILARATDQNRTLIRGRNGMASLVINKAAK